MELDYAQEESLHHLDREIGLVPPWVSLGTKVSENI